MKRVDDDRQGKAGYFDDGRAGAVGCGPELRGRIGCPNTVGKVVAVLLALVVLGASPAHAADAVDDAYTVEPGGSLSVPAPGVLENDCCPSRDSLTASLETPAAHGEVTVNPDGSFTYQHDGQGSTSDSFQYRATDSSDPAVATVFLTVGSASAPEATGDSYSVAEGGSLTVDPPGVLGNDYDPEGSTV
ncbi:MAG: Ig-like domain-containing protein, partial [Gemmatimonadota bacterium]